MVAAGARRARTFRAFGVAFTLALDERLAADGAALEERLETVLPPGSVAIAEEPAAARFELAIEGDRGDRLVARRDGATLGHAHDLAAALDLLEGEVRLHVATESPSLVFVHAGAVAWEGGAIVLPGATLAGKSTLVAALLRAGAGYLSDEYALLDDDGLVHPYPRPPRLRDGHAGAGTPTALSTLGAIAVTTPTPPRLVVATRFEEGARFSPEPLTTGETALALLSHAVAARTAQARVLHAVRRVAERAHGLRSTRGDAKTAAAALLAIASA